MSCSLQWIYWAACNPFEKGLTQWDCNMLKSWRPGNDSQQNMTGWPLGLPRTWPRNGCYPASSAACSRQQAGPHSATQIWDLHVILLSSCAPNSCCSCQSISRSSQLQYPWILDPCNALNVLPCLQVAPIGHLGPEEWACFVPAECLCTAATATTADHATCLLCMLPLRATLSASDKLYMQLTAQIAG